MGRCSTLASFSLTLLIAAAGCTVCQNCDERAYSGYGGKWHRTDRYHGRVGSLFEPAGAPIDDCAVETSVVDSQQPTPAEIPWAEEDGIELTPALAAPEN